MGHASPRLAPIQPNSLTLLGVSGAVNYMDRAAVSIANPLIRHDMGPSLSDKPWGRAAG